MNLITIFCYNIISSYTIFVYLQQIQVLNDQGLLEEDDGDKADLIEDEMERFIHNTEIFLKHHQRIQEIENNRIKLWEIYNNERDPYKREIISDHIIVLHYYISVYSFALKDKIFRK